jgi:glycine hydroxymethyltransferase
MIGKDYDLPAPASKLTLAGIIQKRVFPYFQGAPNQSSIASKARGMAYVASPEFKDVAVCVVSLAKSLAKAFTDKGYRVVFGGTDNHIVVVDVLEKGITGTNAERALEDCGIVVNKNRIPYDQQPPTVTSGIRLGTNGLAIRKMEPADMVECVDLIHEILQATRQISDREYEIDPDTRAALEARVNAIAQRRPIGTYPPPQKS